LTKRERLIRLFKGQDADRPAIKLWALGKEQALLHPDYRPVYELGLKNTELFDGGSCRFDCVFGADNARCVTREKSPVSDEWEDAITTLDTGTRILKQVDRNSLVKKPGYTMEHFVKDADDLKAVLDMPYEPYPVDLSNFKQAVTRVGDDGVALFGLPHPAFGVYLLMGSETLAWMTLENDSMALLEQAVSMYSKRLIAHVKNILDAGIAGITDFFGFSWVGPELIIPPLLSPALFDKFCMGPDSDLINLIHEAGGYAWVHCHGKMANFIDRFARMGVDMLNPIEPPPMGDISLADAFNAAGGRMALEGNIEIGDVMTASPDEIRFLVDRAIAESGARFVLGLTAGYMEVPVPPKTFIDNLLLYLSYGYERVQSLNR